MQQHGRPTPGFKSKGAHRIDGDTTRRQTTCYSLTYNAADNAVFVQKGPVMTKPVELTEEEAKEVAGGTGPSQTTPGVSTSPALRLPPLPGKPSLGGPGLGGTSLPLDR
jgi:hypothetical protein